MLYNDFIERWYWFINESVLIRIFVTPWFCQGLHDFEQVCGRRTSWCKLPPEWYWQQQVHRGGWEAGKASMTWKSRQDAFEELLKVVIGTVHSLWFLDGCGVWGRTQLSSGGWLWLCIMECMDNTNHIWCISFFFFHGVHKGGPGMGSVFDKGTLCGIPK